jgi:ABC-type bacteriocin/lantibiotic exporter with double-glycine peptidase domain
MFRKNTESSRAKRRVDRERFIEGNRRAVDKIGNIIAIFFVILLLIGFINTVFQFLRGLFIEYVAPIITPGNVRATIGTIVVLFIAFLICGFLFGFRVEDGD